MRQVDTYCPNIQTCYDEVDMIDTWQFTIDYCDKHLCATCPFHSNKVKVKVVNKKIEIKNQSVQKPKKETKQK